VLSSGADVLNQLARMRQQLQSERKRVETDLQKEETEPKIYDPRVYAKPSPAPGSGFVLCLLQLTVQHALSFTVDKGTLIFLK
jgi:hypothetical protein